MACIFCGENRKMSREHLWPYWARKALEAESGERVPVVPHVIGGSDGHTESWRAPVFSATLKDVCEVCNTGWMSEIEELTKELVVPMLRNDEVSFGKEEQLCLAVWGYMKILVLERVHAPTQVLPVERYRLLRGHLAEGIASLPRSATVFLATHDGPAIDGGYTHHLIADRGDLRNPFFVATFTLRQVVVQVFDNLAGPTGIIPERIPSLRGRDSQIWPVDESPVRWPTGKSLGDEELPLYAGLADQEDE